MVKAKTKLWCKCEKVESTSDGLFGKTFKVRVPGVEKVLTIAANYINKEALEAFNAGQSMPKNAKVRIDRCYWNLFEKWKKSQKQKKTSCPLREFKKRSGWCTKVQMYITKMNEIIKADKTSCVAMLQQLKDSLCPPSDVNVELTTASFLTNKYAFCPLRENILSPVPGKPDSIRWYVCYLMYINICIGTSCVW